MPGILLDSNHVYDYYRKADAVVARVNSLPANTLILGCTISMGEITAGHGMTKPRDASGQAKRDNYIVWLNEKFSPNALDVTIRISASYAELITRIWNKHPPASKRQQTEQHLFRRGDHKATLAHMVQSGVDINDVWCVAVAMAHGLTFVTSDPMPWIREAAGNDVKWDCWVASTTDSAVTSPPPPPR